MTLNLTVKDLAERYELHQQTIIHRLNKLKSLFGDEFLPVKIDSSNSLYYKEEQIRFLDDLNAAILERSDGNKKIVLEKIIEELRGTQTEIETKAVEVVSDSPAFSLIPADKLAALKPSGIDALDKEIAEFYQSKEDASYFRILYDCAQIGSGLTERELVSLLKEEMLPKNEFVYDRFLLKKFTTDCDRWYVWVIEIPPPKGFTPVGERGLMESRDDAKLISHTVSSIR